MKKLKSYGVAQDHKGIFIHRNDQVHKQNNCLVKGTGEAVGLTENPYSLK